MVIVVFLGKTGSFSQAGSYSRICFASVVENASRPKAGGDAH